MIKVVVVDDDFLVTASLKTILEASDEVQVVATGNSCAEAISLYCQWQPDVLLTDIRMGEQTGIDAATAILKNYPLAKILLLTTFSDDEYVRAALGMGIKGYLIKQDLAAVVPAIKAVYSGQSVFGTAIMEKIPAILTEKPEKKQQFELTPQEEAILLAVAEGMNNKEIAETLFLSEGTIRNYISRLLEKLELRDRTQLAVFYYQKYQ
ncbi:DNA-binding NarL/FixJ family response regulator [Enterococcus sp. PF1-24]|uniref:response regulator transcription factor n=1 Tax=unclassified Enterococcus TaxID=2608891 RepID=UPI0024740CA1|nr:MULTISPECIES: response regulator transcription factor [unclassified Enterococcus]MDH6365534.1 DNA-binding NarL/FixJ family response regulator [Enterococcus sp. PFB1-1]MDH6402635.1 DNA-binding NarL/FixJ family response regulator [Enterococcus sp. PF1-24]